MSEKTERAATSIPWNPAMTAAAEAEAAPPRRSHGRIAVVLLLWLGAGTGTYAALEPRISAARKRANIRACFANQKTMVGAVEMYNLDKCTKVTDLDSVLPQLKEGGYLQSLPDDPGQGAGTVNHYRLTGSSGNGITCTKHGSIPH